MERFRADGHLTDEALLALIRQEEQSELERLEIAEHLAFCDACLQRYTELLAESPLLTPVSSCRQSLWQHLRARAAGQPVRHSRRGSGSGPDSALGQCRDAAPFHISALPVSGPFGDRDPLGLAGSVEPLHGQRFFADRRLF